MHDSLEKANELEAGLYTAEARDLVRTFTHNNDLPPRYSAPESGTATPAVDRHPTDYEYVPRRHEYKPGIFGAILTSKINDLEHRDKQRERVSASTSPGTQPRSEPAQYLDLARWHGPRESVSKHSRSKSQPHSGTSSPRKTKWYDEPEKQKSYNSTQKSLIQVAMSSSMPSVPEAQQASPQSQNMPHRSSNLISSAVDILKKGGHREHRQKQPKNIDVVAEVADILARRKYLLRLCNAFMLYGAPTHRLEEYLSSSARALCIDADFMYIPGAMMITFIDHTIQTNSVDLVRSTEGVDLGRLKDVVNVYKCVIHDKLTAEEGIRELDQISRRPEAYSIWFRILLFGLASVFVGPFSFYARPIDFGPIFLLGSALGYLQLKVVPLSKQFSNVFEVFACVVTAIAARGLGSVLHNGEYVFCFSAMAQSSIAMILPGFLVLNSALELQSRNMVSGSVRMVYAIIYVLFLAFGLLVGTAIFGLIKNDAVDATTCSLPSWFSGSTNWTLIYTRFVWVPLFAACIAIIYRAKWSQVPVMVLIAVSGQQANFWVSKVLSNNLQVANAVSSFVIGCLANLYSRLFHGLAAASMLPAIYCIVPGGLAASGSLVAGIESSEVLVGNTTAMGGTGNSTLGTTGGSSSMGNASIMNVGYGMVQVAIGISVSRLIVPLKAVFTMLTSTDRSLLEWTCNLSIRQA